MFELFGLLTCYRRCANHTNCCIDSLTTTNLQVCQVQRIHCKNMERTAIIAGCTGIGGLALSKRLLKEGWKVYGISRRKPDFIPAEVNHVQLDLLDSKSCETQLAPLTDVTHVFITTWINKINEKDNITANEAVITNILDSFKHQLQHVVLVTGTKQYVGPFESFAYLKPEDAMAPFKESSPRLPFPNFYYNQEDVLWDRAAKKGFKWSVARPPIIIGFAPYNQMNFGSSLAVYATLCKELNLPLIFPGGKAHYDNYVDTVHSDLLASHLLWQATEPKAANQVFNINNGDVVRWRHMWKAIADYFGLEVPEPADPVDLTELMGDKGPVWDEIVKKYGLKPFKVDELAHFWLIDAGVSLPIDFFASISKCREAGYLEYLDSEKGVIKLFDFLRENKYIP